MKLTTDRGELGLPADFSFDITQSNPMLSDDGTSSIPVELPASPENLAVLGHPERLAGRSRFIRKMSAQLTQGVYHKDGQLLVDSVQEDAGVTVALAFNESDLYSQFKEKSIRELFADHIANDYRDTSAPVQNLYEYLFSVYEGEQEDNFTLFPVAVSPKVKKWDFESSSDIEAFQINNRPLMEGEEGTDLWELEWRSRDIKEKEDEYVTVPDGYGIAPFLYLGKFIDLLFSKMGYTVGSNPFRTDNTLCRIVLLHSVTDVICKGRICYADLVPSVTVSEFLEALENRFHAFVSVHPSTGSVDVMLMEEVFSASPDLDLTPSLDGLPTVRYNDPSHIVLRPDVSIDDTAQPVGQTLEEIVAKYPIMTELSDEQFWREQHNVGRGYDVVLLKSTGCVYERLRQTMSVAAKFRYAGTVNCSYDKKKTDNPEEITAKDVSALMVQQDDYTMPYVGNRSHRNTSYKGEDENDEKQPVIFCFAAGLAEQGQFQQRRYNYGTTQKSNNVGTADAFPYSLQYDDMYEGFFRQFNEMRMNNASEVTARFDLPASDVMHFQPMALKSFRSNRALVKSLAYTVGSDIRAGNCVFIPLMQYPDAESDVRPQFQPQLYAWSNDYSEIEAYVAEFEGFGYDVGWRFVTEGDEDEEEWVYVAPPTSPNLRDYARRATVRFDLSHDDHFIRSETRTVEIALESHFIW